MLLSELKQKETAYITKVKGRGAFRKRIIEMGFISGKKITVTRFAPLSDPIEYSILGYSVMLRRSEAKLIEISKTVKDVDNNYSGMINGSEKLGNGIKSKEINIALVGNPNSGKTTFFNYASGSKERVGNYSGVTVGSKTATYKLDGYTFNIVDLPGTYSLSAYSPEELFVRQHIQNELPDIVINVIDASNLERNLYLTSQLIDMDIKVIIVLNMFDELLLKGDKFDYITLGEMIGCPIIPAVSTKGKGIKDVFKRAIEVYEDRDDSVRHIHINYGKNIEKAISSIQNEIRESKNQELQDRISTRFLAIKLIEKDRDTIKLIYKYCPNFKNINIVVKEQTDILEETLKEDSESLIADAKYGFISGALKETYKPGAIDRRELTDKIDTFITNKVFGFPFFLLSIWIMFETTFSVGEYPMRWLESFVNICSNAISTYMHSGILKDLIIDGIIGGIGGVIVFLPNILLLFFFISLLEDTGYMARVVFIMDKIMHKFGLHGRSFIPLIMGFGCNVPAIMSTRTIESRNDRMVTMLVNPFMSCGARLPVYILLIGAFFPKHSGTVLFTVYFIGVIVALTMAVIFKKTLFKEKDIPFVMELPPYRLPTLKSTLKHMWENGSQYIRKMGTVILVSSIIIWALGYFPRETKYSVNYDTQIKKLEKKQYQAQNKIINNKKIALLKLKKESERQEHSYIGKLGKFIEPLIKPLGFDWKIGVSIITGIAAKEIVVSTMGVLYQADIDAKEHSKLLKNKIKSYTHKYGPKKGQKVFTPLIAFGFMVFVLLYFPCIAAIAAIRRESGSWKWAVFTAVYSTAIAWVFAFIIYQVGSIFFH